MAPLDPGWRLRLPADETVVALVRHGRTSWNHERRFLGQTDIALDEEGWRQARALADRLGAGSFDAVYSSPLARAWQTATCLHADPIALDAVRELHQGELEGLRGPAAMARFPMFFAAFARDPEHAEVPGGEQLGACRDRALEALQEVAAGAAPGATVAVVTHQLVIASVRCTLLGEPLTRWRRYGVGNADVVALCFDGAALRERPLHAGSAGRDV